MHLTGIMVGLFSFIIIGVFHPIVIKCEYHFSWRIWPVFLLAGAGLLIASVITPYMVASCFLSVAGFTCLWSIGELKEQHNRVKRGWFPENPNRKQWNQTD